MIEEDEDLKMDKGYPKTNKNFGSTGLGNYKGRPTARTGDNELNQLLENRQELMKHEIKHARRPINRSPVPMPEPEDEDDNLDYDQDIAATLKFKSDTGKQSYTKPVELKALDGDDDFEGMDGGNSSNRDMMSKPSKPLLVPMAKNRVKLQPMSINPLA